MLGKSILRGCTQLGERFGACLKVLFISLLFLSGFSSFAGQLTATLKDSATGAILPGHKVVAYQLDETDSKKWRASVRSDDNGQVSFELEALGSGGRYVLMARVYNNFKVYTQVITEPGEQLIVLGSTRVEVLNGTQTAQGPLVDTKVHIYTLNEGSKSWFSSAYTDDNGYLRIDLPGIEAGQQYLLGSKSPVSGQNKYSAPLTASGDHVFVVGNIPLNVALRDGISGVPIGNQRVDAYYFDSEDKKRWYARASTDDTGNVDFDFERLGKGKQYILRTKYYNGIAAYSDRLNATGGYEFKVGKTALSVVNGSVSPNQPLVGHRVDFHQLNADGSKTWYARANTDDSGVIRLNLVGIEQGQIYTARAKSPIDGRTYYEHTFSAQGQAKLMVGSTPLNVTLKDALSGEVLSGKEISAYESFADGSKKRVAKATTDTQGQVQFDLVDIGSGRNYYLAVKGFGDFRTYSPILTGAGEFAFNVGSTRVTLKDGSVSSLPPIAGAKLAIYTIEDDRNRWFGSATADASGQVRMDLPGFNEGKVYRFRAYSTVNNTKKFSQPLTQAGDFTFVVGNPAVAVRVFNILSNELYAEQKVTAYNFDEAGKRQWYGRLVTDANGQVLFDLDGIGQGREYVFQVSKFSTGASYSAVINSPTHVDMGIGAAPVTLVDKETGNSLGNVKVYGYKIQDNGDLLWAGTGRSDSNGQLTFDFPELSQGQRYTFKAKSPFGEGKRYYGPIITSIGPVTFAMKKGEYGQLDLEPPMVAIDTPVGDDANSGGFIVSGIVSDNQGVERVDVQVGGNQIAASVDVDTGRWQAKIAAAMLDGMTSIAIVVTATDVALNSAVTSRNYNLIDDAAPPVITITSHQDLQPVNVVGFTVLGNVTDDVAVESITATLTDPLLGQTIVDLPLNISSLSGQWALPVTNGRVSSGQTVTVALVATDINGKTSEANVLLNTVAVSNNPLQLAQRITFGLTPQLLGRINRGDDYLTEQLNPDAIDDSEFEAQMAARIVADRDDLKDYLVSYMTGSQKQLREVMAWFWENHFNTNINTHGSVSFEFNENRQFRQHALGRFRDLLGASAKSAAMIQYLNNAQNVVGRPNENYAREIMELHTLGVDGGYSGQDIVELSRIFTGWHQSDGVFAFNDELHDNGDKTFLGQSIVGSGVLEGEQVLDILSTHPSTASFICSKLVTLFVSDQPVNDLQSQCAAEFLASDGNIAAVLQVIFGSQAFAASDNYRSKLKTPLEWVTATIRGFNTSLNPGDVDEAMRLMGMRLFEFPAPTGFSEVAEDWLNSNAVLQRMRLALVASERVDVRALMSAQGFTSAEAIVSYLFELALGNEFTELEYQLALSILNDNEPFDFNANEADAKMTQLLGTVMTFPGYQYQ